MKIFVILFFTLSLCYQFFFYTPKTKVIIPLQIVQNTHEVECLARNIYFEARNQSIKGQYAVGFVTLNRVRSNQYPKTICEVVYQPYQFSWTIDLKYANPKNKKAWETAVLISTNIIGGKIKDDITQGALHYHADYVNPKWNRNMVKVRQIDNHIFYKNI
jgi:spore germination cell wall hydrolase CwlJ-like protein